MSRTSAFSIGMLTPSSNTVLEPLTAGMLRDVPNVEAHLARFHVVEISLSAAALGQFDMAPMLDAADLLADAKVDVIVWNGTSAGWLGFDRDEALCAAVTERAGIAASSSVLALNAILAKTGVETIAFVTPDVAEIEARTVDNYRRMGLACVAARRKDLRENSAFAQVLEGEVEAVCCPVADAEPEATLIFCTNLRGAAVAPRVEARTGRVAHDTVATALWGAFAATGSDPSQVRGWGQAFEVKA